MSNFNCISKGVGEFYISPICLHHCRLYPIKITLSFNCLLVYFSTPWADCSHTCSSSYLEEGTKPELGHWFELILDPLAIWKQLLCFESSLHNQLSFFSDRTMWWQHLSGYYTYFLQKGSCKHTVFFLKITLALCLLNINKYNLYLFHYKSYMLCLNLLLFSFSVCNSTPCLHS